MAQPQADPAYATSGATWDDRASSGYSAPSAREERPMRQVSPYSQATMPPAAPAPARQAPQEEEEEDEANSYDSDEATTLGSLEFTPLVQSRQQLFALFACIIKANCSRKQFLEQRVGQGGTEADGLQRTGCTASHVKLHLLPGASNGVRGDSICGLWLAFPHLLSEGLEQFCTSPTNFEDEDSDVRHVTPYYME
uniref:Uncharacterized protein n=1 Tax=Sphaerodactylus townsendi TaxID=933632 RepID=A0ACB8FZJ2_9SAUR